MLGGSRGSSGHGGCSAWGGHLFCVIGLGTCSSLGTSSLLRYVKLVLFGEAGYRMGKGYAGSEAGKENWFWRGRMGAGKGLTRCKSGQGWGGQSDAEKLWSWRRSCGQEASMMWGGGEGGGRGIVPFGIKPLG